jgi:hypothetical protein
MCFCSKKLALKQRTPLAISSNNIEKGFAFYSNIYYNLDVIDYRFTVRGKTGRIPDNLILPDAEGHYLHVFICEK